MFGAVGSEKFVKTDNFGKIGQVLELVSIHWNCQLLHAFVFAWEIRLVI